MPAYQIEVTIDRSLVPGSDKVNFPILFSHLQGNIPDDFFLNISDGVDGEDIRFYDDILLSNEYKREIVKIDTSSKIIEAWVQIPLVNGSLNSVDTTFICQVGNGTRSNDTEIWDDLDAQRVYHFENNVNDSTINAQNGTIFGASPIISKFGANGYSFDGVTDRIEVPRIPLSSGGPHEFLNIELWAKMLSFPTVEDPNFGFYNETLWCQAQLCPSSLRGWRDFEVSILETGKVAHHVEFTTNCSMGSAYQRARSDNDQFTVGAWKHIFIAGTNYNGAATRNVEFFVNGQSIAKSYNGYFSGNIGVSATQKGVFGALWKDTTNYVNHFHGVIDEARIYINNTGLPMDADWIQANFNTQNDPSTFLSIQTISNGKIPFNLLNRITHAGNLDRPASSIPIVISGTHGWFDGIPATSDIIVDHVARAKALLVEQFEKSPNLLGLVGIYVKQIQDIENAISNVIQSRNLESATNAQLDIIGERAGEPRNFRDDDTYRAAIKVRIFLNHSSGEPESVRAAAKAFTQATTVYLYELQPATLWIHIITNFTLPSDLLSNLEEIALAGVKLIITFALDSDDDFGFDGEGGFSPAVNTLGFGEEGLPSEGGRFVENIT